MRHQAERHQWLQGHKVRSLDKIAYSREQIELQADAMSMSDTEELKRSKSRHSGSSKFTTISETRCYGAYMNCLRAQSHFGLDSYTSVASTDVRQFLSIKAPTASESIDFRAGKG